MVNPPTPTTIAEAINFATKHGRDYELNFAPECEGYNETWVFENGEIKGPPSSDPDNSLNERWINRWMEELYVELGIKPLESNAYYRFANGSEEYEEAKLGNFSKSKNHRSKTFESGKSVASGPFLTYFHSRSHSFLLKGDRLDNTCSDGAPLLEINDNLKLASDLMSIPELLTKFYRRNKGALEKTARKSGIGEIKLFNLSMGIWDNYWPKR